MKLISEQIDSNGSVKPQSALSFLQLQKYITKVQENPEELSRKKSALEHLIIASWKEGLLTGEEKYDLLNSLGIKIHKVSIPVKSPNSLNSKRMVLLTSNFIKKHKILLILVPMLCVCLLSIIGFSMLFISQTDEGTVQGARESVYSEQVLRFKGVLYDRNGQPIQDKVDVRFGIYSSATGESAVYSGECYGENGLTPDATGSFSIAIGSDCGMSPIPEQVLSNMKNTYLGITVGNNPEMKPRYPIATVDHSKNANQIQGLSPGSNESTIPYIDQEGVFKIAAVSPLIQSTAGIFTIEGQSVVLQASDEENGSVVIGGPAGLGLQTTQIIDDITLGGSMSPDKNASYDLGSETMYFSTTYTNNIVVAEEGVGAYWQRKSNTLSPTYPDDSIALGFVTGSKPSIYLSSSKDGSSWVVNRAFGVGTATPEYLFTASGSVAGSSTVSLSNLTKSDTFLTNVLRLNLGSKGSNASFIDFYADSTNDTNGKKVGSIGIENGNLTFKTGGADFAEYMTVIESTEPGYIIAATSAGNAKAMLDERPIGVVTDVAGIIGNYEMEDEKGSALIGLLGQIPTFVSTLQGTIEQGSAVGVSSIPGFGQVALTPQTIVGTVISTREEINRSLKNELCPRAFLHMTDPEGNPIRCGRINVLVSPQWHEPLNTSASSQRDKGASNTTPEYTNEQTGEVKRIESQNLTDEEKTPLELYIERSKQMQR